MNPFFVAFMDSVCLFLLLIVLGAIYAKIRRWPDTTDMALYFVGSFAIAVLVFTVRSCFHLYK